MVISGFHPSIGGAERQCLKLCRGLRKSGVDARVLTFQLRPGWPLEEEIWGVPVRRIRLPSLRFRGLPDLLLLLYLLRYAREHDIIHNHIISSHTTSSVWVGKLWRKPVVVKFANSGQRNDLRLARQRLPWPLSRWVERAVYSADAVIATCSVISNELTRDGLREENIVSIPNGVELDVFVPADDLLRRKRRQEMALPNDACIVLRVGTLEPKKGVGTLLKAWQRVAGPHPNVLLLSVGGEKVPVELQKQASPWDNQIRFMPNTEDVVSCYQAADIFVLPSFAEGLSNALLEAQACGLASVVTRVGGNPEVVKDGENGLLVQPGDVKALASALTRLIENPTLGAIMGQRAREMSQRYAMPRVVEQYLGLYKQLVKKRDHNHSLHDLTLS